MTFQARQGIATATEGLAIIEITSIMDGLSSKLLKSVNDRMTDG